LHGKLLVMEMPTLLWTPDHVLQEESQLRKYQDWLEQHHQLRLFDYAELWAWSTAQPAAFWESLWQYFDIITHAPHTGVMSDDPMPHTRWFAGSRLNYAEHIFRQYSEDRPAIVFQSERHPLQEISWAVLREQTAALAASLRALGVEPGDRVCAYLPNIPEATIAFLATCSLGAVWSSCSPDFGAGSVVDRFQQISPKVLIAADGYAYNGKAFDRMDTIRNLQAQLPSLVQTILVPFLDEQADAGKLPGAMSWAQATATTGALLQFEPVPFEHPIWVLYSSGTTGLPKAITHSQGGVLLEHLKYLHFHNDVRPGERFFWFSTTGWMMWNFVQASLLCGATIVLYDGSPGYPDMGVLWALAEQAGIHHFGTSAPFLMATEKSGLSPYGKYPGLRLRSLSSTGSPLPPASFAWVYAHVNPRIWLCSMSGGTDVCTAFVGGCPLLPVYEGEIQCRALGCALAAYDDAGAPLIGEVGEMVITGPMPSMPVFFWNDPGGLRYQASYFDDYPGVWRHGDWVRISPQGTLAIFGRSDATLNRQGVRIGTSEIYQAVHKIEAVKDSLVVNLEYPDGRHYMPLFVLMHEGYALTEEIKAAINRQLRLDFSPRHVPDAIIAVPDIPYTISGKKMEAPVKKILLGYSLEKAASRDAMRNPDSLLVFAAMAADLAT
jgi:acetoacetyl-CoA synthetase